MDWPGGRILLKWREPRAIRRYLDRLDRRKHYWKTVLACLSVVALVMLNWWLAVLNPEKNPVPFGTALAMSIGFTGVLVLSVSLVYRYAPSRIMVQRDWIRWRKANCLKTFKYVDIESCDIERKTINGRDFPVLSLTTKKGKVFLSGIDSSVDLDELEKILFERIRRTKCENKEDNSIKVNPNL